MESRFDAADSFFITQQLQSFDPTQRYHLVPGVVGRKYIPPFGNVSPNMPSFKYTMTKVRGDTKKSGRKAKDAPTVSVVTEEVVHSIKTFEHNASWTIDEIRASREAGADLDMANMVAAMAAVEEDFDSALCSGISGTAVTGLANNANVAATTAAGTWDTATVAAIIADITKWIKEASVALKQAQVPGSGMRMFNQFVAFIPEGAYHILSMTQLTNTEATILDFISKFPALKAVVPWWRLDTANSGSRRGVLAPALDNGSMNPMAGGALLPSDFERLPEQYSGRTVTVPCAGKCGGVAMPYPIAFRYMNTF